ncbi:hypothetical protein [Catenuloplanes japonicus]|uniref:hypothetical protein n=1 Tax=Catenuloplanes japonicus TaxID=33876 RepID=UPI000526B9A3|nr:hypothetical protein [Catenuloplanes japonicus]
MSGGSGAGAPRLALIALRGTLEPAPYDSRAIMRSAGNPECRVLPTAAAMGVTIDAIAERAHAVGMGPDPRRAMSQNARLQGETFDANMLTDGLPVLEVLQADGWVNSIDVIINVDDHFTKPALQRGTTASGGKKAEEDRRWRLFHRRRARYTASAVAAAMQRSGPTMILRGVVETTSFAGTPEQAFGEFDVALILPPGCVPVRVALHAEVGLSGGNPHGLIMIGDAKSWRRRGRLDDGDKRATVAKQIALYVAAARATWPNGPAGAVSMFGFVVNPPSAGGLSTAKLTRIDLSHPLEKLLTVADRSATAVADVEAALVDAVADGARFDKADAGATRVAVATLLRHAAWNPSCLAACPLGQACRRRLDDSDSVTRLGGLVAQAGPVATITRLGELRRGAAPTPSESDVAAEFSAAGALLGTPIPLPWRPRTGDLEATA